MLFLFSFCVTGGESSVGCSLSQAAQLHFIVMSCFTVGPGVGCVFSLSHGTNVGFPRAAAHVAAFSGGVECGVSL